MTLRNRESSNFQGFPQCWSSSRRGRIPATTPVNAYVTDDPIVTVMAFQLLRELLVLISNRQQCRFSRHHAASASQRSLQSALRRLALDHPSASSASSPVMGGACHRCSSRCCTGLVRNLVADGVWTYRVGFQCAASNARRSSGQTTGSPRAYAPLFPGFSGVFMENTRYSYDGSGMAMRCIGHNTIGKSQDCTAKV